MNDPRNITDEQRETVVQQWRSAVWKGPGLIKQKIHKFRIITVMLGHYYE